MTKGFLALFEEFLQWPGLFCSLRRFFGGLRRSKDTGSQAFIGTSKVCLHFVNRRILNFGLGKFIHFLDALDDRLGQFGNVLFVGQGGPLSHKALLALAKEVEIFFVDHCMLGKQRIDGRPELIYDLEFLGSVQKNTALVDLSFQISQAQN